MFVEELVRKCVPRTLFLPGQRCFLEECNLQARQGYSRQGHYFCSAGCMTRWHAVEVEKLYQLAVAKHLKERPGIQYTTTRQLLHCPALNGVGKVCGASLRDYAVYVMCLLGHTTFVQGTGSLWGQEAARPTRPPAFAIAVSRR